MISGMSLLAIRAFLVLRVRAWSRLLIFTPRVRLGLLCIRAAGDDDVVAFEDIVGLLLADLARAPLVLRLLWVIHLLDESPLGLLVDGPVLLLSIRAIVFLLDIRRSTDVFGNSLLCCLAWFLLGCLARLWRIRVHDALFFSRLLRLSRLDGVHSTRLRRLILALSI